MNNYEPLRGMNDLYGEEMERVDHVISTFGKVCRNAGYLHVDVPILEDFSLFAIKSGEELRQSMYVFNDKGGRTVALRPEFTPGVIRAYLNSMQAFPKPVNLYYSGTVYRYDEPQRGRYREFRQAGVESIGSIGLASDIEVIFLFYNVFEELGISQKVTLKVGNVGVLRSIMGIHEVPEEIQQTVLHYVDKENLEGTKEVLSKFILEEHKMDFVIDLISTHRQDFREITERARSVGYDQVIPQIDYLARLKELLDASGIRSIVDPGFVRGIAYYTGIIFEALHEDVKYSIGGGGRYDSLVEVYGGNPTPAIGFAIGVERTASLIPPLKREEKKILVVTLADRALSVVYPLLRGLRRRDVITIMNVKETRLSKLIPMALEQGYTYMIILGEKELKDNSIVIRDLTSAKQEIIFMNQLEDYFDKII